MVGNDKAGKKNIASASTAGVSSNNKSRIHVPNNLLFTFLDKSVLEYTELLRRFCEDTDCDVSSWTTYAEPNDLKEFLLKIVAPKKVIVIAAGNLCKSIIKDIHDLEQVLSIYIYCFKIKNYQDLKQGYAKVSDVFDKPTDLLERVCNDIKHFTKSLPPDIPADIKQTPLVSSRPSLTVEERGRFQTVLHYAFIFHSFFNFS